MVDSEDQRQNSHLEERMKLYPGVYDNPEELQQDLKEFMVYERDDQPQEKVQIQIIPTPSKVQTTEPSSSPIRRTTRRVADNTDIWGNLHTKEADVAASVVCPVCRKSIPNRTRFAPHLDKCMGIGTMQRNQRGAAAAAAGDW